MSSQLEDHFACIGLVFKSNTTRRAFQRKQKLKVDKETEGERRPEATTTHRRVCERWRDDDRLKTGGEYARE